MSEQQEIKAIFVATNMYNRKLRGEKIDPRLDFRGAVANRSEFSVCTLPPLNQSITQRPRRNFSNNEKARVLSQELHAFKTAKELAKLKDATLLSQQQETPTQSIVSPKRRSQNNRQSMMSKLGKRISTIGGMFDNNDTKEHKLFAHNSEKKRSTSLGFLTMKSGPEMDFDSVVNEDNASLDDIVDMALDMKLEQADSGVDSANHTTGKIQLETPPPAVISNPHNELVYTKDNQLYINFPNDSQSSLVSKLLDAYSKFYPEETDISIKTPRLENNRIFTFRPPEESILSSHRDSAGTSVSASTGNDLFSTAQTSYYTNSSESLHEILRAEIKSEGPPRIQLSTTSYNKKLPPVPSRRIDQFCIRNYSDSSQNAIIIDKEVPPKTPTHAFSASSSSDSPETRYFDCTDSFSKVSSVYSTDDALLDLYGDVKPDADDASQNTLEASRKTELPLDTKIFTRKNTRKHYVSLSKTSREQKHEKQRSLSEQYMEKAGITPFMLTGYQEQQSHLQVVNQ